MSTTGGAGMALGGEESLGARTAGWGARGGDGARRVVVARAAHRGLAAQGRVGEAAVAPSRARAAVLRAVEGHEGVVLRLVGLLHLRVRQPDDLVVAVAVEVGHRRRRRGPL